MLSFMDSEPSQKQEPTMEISPVVKFFELLIEIDRKQKKKGEADENK